MPYLKFSPLAEFMTSKIRAAVKRAEFGPARLTADGGGLASPGDRRFPTVPWVRSPAGRYSENTAQRGKPKSQAAYSPMLLASGAPAGPAYASAAPRDRDRSARQSALRS